MTTVEYVSVYDLRVKLVQDTLANHSTLGDHAAHELAVHVLDALDHIPEKVR
ncbi:DUF6307 family protein [Amycolatopsis nalaikhensis]|uniref:DUF6307 family protein n=1 Tax=Amycolatopsis nalaikhensis TaxID=715472 RepID=A0ABY8XQA9_9PSEU|nr:DUF6307 family protein [Amycolatopsis sp. 2-2]WIV57839.1 DUF6307 family protein [Amycolatopsis sp. 2-2]